MVAMLAELPLAHKISSRLRESVIIRSLSFMPPSCNTLNSVELLYPSHTDSIALHEVYAEVTVYLAVLPLQRSGEISDFVEALQCWNKRENDLKSSTDKDLISEALSAQMAKHMEATFNLGKLEELKERDVFKPAVVADINQIIEEALTKQGPTTVDIIYGLFGNSQISTNFSSFSDADIESEDNGTNIIAKVAWTEAEEQALTEAFTGAWVSPISN